MKKRILLVVALCMVMLSSVALMACGDSDDETVTYTYSISDTSKELIIGQEFQLSVTAEPTKDLSVTYSSMQPEIASVTANGLVEAKAVGVAAITATVDGEVLNCIVTVTNYVIDFTVDSVNLTYGTTAELSYTVTPETTEKAVYTSSNPAVVAIEGDKVKAVGIGSSIITATLNGATATCVVNVKGNYAGMSEVTLKTTQTAQISLTLEPSTIVPSFTYLSNNPEIATVSASGLITGIAVGNTKIAVSDGGVKVKEITVYVEQKYEYALNHTTALLGIGDELDLDVTATPDKEFAVGTIIFSSENNSIASVDNMGMGIVTAKGEGTVNINVEVEGETLTCVVTVELPIAPIATVSQVLAQSGDKYNLSESYQGLVLTDWQLYGAGSEHDDRMKTSAPLIDGNANVAGVGRLAFWDYKTEMSFTNGTTNKTRMGITSGVATAKVSNSGNYEINVTLTEKTKLIRIFTGGYKATGEVKMMFGEYEVGVTSFTVGDAGEGYRVDFELDLSKLDFSEGHEDYIVNITVTPIAGNENVTLVAAQTFDGDPTFVPEVYEGAMPTSGDATFTAAKTEYNLSTVDGYQVQDWVYLGANDTEKDKKKNVDTLISVTLPDKAASFPDYATKLSYIDGTVKETASGLKNGSCAAKYEVGYLYEIDVKLTQDTTQIRIFTGAWNADNTTSLYYKGVLDKSKTLSTAGYVTFNIDTSVLDWTVGHEEHIVNIIVRASRGGGAHNASLVAAQVLSGDGTVIPDESPAPTATASFVDGPATYNLSANQEGLKTTDWMYFSGVQAEDDRKVTNDKVITAALDSRADGFWDYKTQMIFNDGSKANAKPRRGICNAKFDNGNAYNFIISLNANISQVRIFTGAYNATGKALMFYNNEEISSVEWTGTDPSKCGYAQFNISTTGMDFSVAREVKIVISATAGEGNVSMVAIQTLDTDATAVTTASATATLVGTPEDVAGKEYNIADYGTTDWLVMRSGTTPITKNGNDNLIKWLFRNGPGGGNNYTATIKYGDGAEDKSTAFENTGIAVDFKVTLTANQIVSMFTFGYKDKYSVMIFDENNILVDTILIQDEYIEA